METHPPTSFFHPRRVLVRGVNWLGDAVMATPALMRLREHFDAAHIALLTSEKLADLWINHPAINEVIPFAPREGVFSIGAKLRRRFDRTGEPISNGSQSQQADRAYARGTRFDLALILPNSPRSAIETWLAGIAERVGYARPWRNVFLTQAIQPRAGTIRMRKRSVAEIRRLVAADVSRGMTVNGRAFTGTAARSHQIYEYLHLAGGLGANPEPVAPQLFVQPDEIEKIRLKFGLEKIVQPVFGVNAGAEYGPAKRWPADRFIAAAREIQQRTNCLWVIFGAQNDLVIANAIHSALGTRHSALNLAGQTSLRELMALLKICRVLLTNDSGPMHVAAALGTPVVAPFGSTSPELTAPGLPGEYRHRLLTSGVPCSPCFLRECPIDFRCMNAISVERVVNAVLEATTPSSPSASI